MLVYVQVQCEAQELAPHQARPLNSQQQYFCFWGIRGTPTAFEIGPFAFLPASTSICVCVQAVAAWGEVLFSVPVVINKLA